MRCELENYLKTKYPVMLVHGIGHTDENYKRYWGRIPDFLQSQGVDLYFGKQDAFGTIESNALQIKESVQNALAESGSEKVNIIAHSKGGLEARYMISKLGMRECVASLTTLATPHRGVKAMDKLKEHNLLTYRMMLQVFNSMLFVSGGELNKNYRPYEQLTRDFMQVFNELVPNVEGVYYQSYAFDMKNGASYPELAVFHKIVEEMEGINDGLVSVEFAKWGNFCGIYSGPADYGIAHSQVVDSKLRPITTEQSGGGILDILDLYFDIVERLKTRGY